MDGKTRFFHFVAQEAIVGIAAFDLQSRRCVYLNNLARETLEFPSQANADVLSVDDLFVQGSASDGVRLLNDEMLKSEGHFQDVLMGKTNGLRMMVDVGVKNVELEAGVEAVLLMFQDITIQKKLQREIQLKQEEIRKAYTELLEQNKQLKELDHAKDKFIALTTHELRTPLAAIVATAEVLQMGLYESEEQRESFVQTLHEQALHVMELVNDVLDFAKVRAGKMEYYVEEIDLVPLLKKLTSNFDPMAAQAHVSIHLEFEDESARVFADMIRIREVFNNVVNNAIKYNRDGGEVRITLARRDEAWRVIVADTGQGIAPDKIKHVFNEFETVGSVARHHKGTGLGMPISKHLMRDMGGDLSLESREGVGTSFFIDIPTSRVLPESFYRSRPDSWGDLAA